MAVLRSVLSSPSAAVCFIYAVSLRVGRVFLYTVILTLTPHAYWGLIQSNKEGSQNNVTHPAPIMIQPLGTPK